MSKLIGLLVVISCVFSTTGLAHPQEEPKVMIFSADGRYTSDKKYLSVRVIESETSVEEANLTYKGTLFNPGEESLDKIKLVIDLYGEHELLTESYIPIYQCKHSLEESVSGGQSIDFSGVCKNIPQSVATGFKKHRISVGKQ